MAVETLHPYDDDQVVREIVPGGYDNREYLLYPDLASARIAQKLHSSRFVPQIIASLMDEGIPMRDNPFKADEPAESSFLHETISEWEQQIPPQELNHAA